MAILGKTVVNFTCLKCNCWTCSMVSSEGYVYCPFCGKGSKLKEKKVSDDDMVVICKLGETVKKQMLEHCNGRTEQLLVTLSIDKLIAEIAYNKAQKKGE